MDKELGKIRKKYTSDKAMTGEEAGLELGRHTRMLGRPRRYKTQAMAFLVSSVWMRGLLAAVALTLGAAAGCCARTPPVALTSLALSVATWPRTAAYDKRKYMWKLLYTRLLGYDVDFGVKNASDLIAAAGCACCCPLGSSVPERTAAVCWSGRMARWNAAGHVVAALQYSTIALRMRFACPLTSALAAVQPTCTSPAMAAATLRNKWATWPARCS